MDLKDFIREIPDFPKPGISFKDITPLLLDPQATQYALQELLSEVEGPVDKVVAMESRGFFFGLLLAKELGAGFVPVRKPNKLPFQTISKGYELEYGMDTLEMHIDAVKAGERVLVHDDVLATGGTAAAVRQMLEEQEAQIVQFNFLMELSFLKGRDYLGDHTTHAVLRY
ncbi:adenine phosphoribosyltransferase [Robertkochia aurantiaca]|uniref:adenine phosphoribosyltransferase n=1 Tax=Robertkochia aurantiaca TaxID=2873700 RepID=UPI001CCE8CB9|nr:adenine phosphoribosyltransferase [Robertkochia sp. 3YJGBD-33]